MQPNPATGLAPLDVQLLWLPEAMPGHLFDAIDVPHRRRAPPLNWRLLTPAGVDSPFTTSYTGMNPSVYQPRFALRARRQHWKVERQVERKPAS